MHFESTVPEEFSVKGSRLWESDKWAGDTSRVLKWMIRDNCVEWRSSTKVMNGRLFLLPMFLANNVPQLLVSIHYSGNNGLGKVYVHL